MSLQSVTLQDFLITAAGLFVFIKYIIDTYRGMQKPNVEQDKKIMLLEAGIAGINSDLKLVKENHIFHIEENIKNLQLGQEKIFTILEERLPLKK